MPPLLGRKEYAKDGGCAQDDGLNEIIDKLREAEGFIVGAPVYFGTARGDVMCALQRVGHISRATGRFLARELIVPGSSYWNMVFGRLQGEALNDDEGTATIRHFAENVANLIKKLHRQ